LIEIPATEQRRVDTGIGEIVGVCMYEPLEEPVPKPKRRPMTAPRVESTREHERSDVEAHR
jgi:hypothetical protein